MLNVREICDLQRELVELWHNTEYVNDFDGVRATICTQHHFNFLLWHEEDIARSPDASDSRIADVKRAIDRFNQQRNDWIEKIDDEISEILASQSVRVRDDSAAHTETPGSAFDRLSIMALRIYHLREQLERDDVETGHHESVQHKLAVCIMQHEHLADALQDMLDGIFEGRISHRTYRQFKMYNDPTLNPYLYKAKSGVATDVQSGCAAN